jgi:hypothetical protein
MSMHSIYNDAIELNRHVQAGQRSSVTDKTIDRIEETLGASGGNLAYARLSL